MKTIALFQTLLLAAAITPSAGALTAQPVSLTHVHPQFGPIGSMGVAKLLQELHLPASPLELFQFLLEYFLKQKLGNTLPLNLDASHAYPIVENAQLPGGPFKGKPITPTAASFHTALAPGDYVVPVMAYCTQYSVHRPGQGTAYKLAPVEGTEAGAISTLLWRGTLAGKSPRDLQAANWAIQAGVTYDSMPKPYQALVDQLIPEYRGGLRGNMFDVIQSTYKEVTTDPRKALQTYIREKYNKTLPVMLLPKIAVPAPPLETVLAKMGAPGMLLLDAKKQSNILLTAYTTKERGEQVLFEGQGEQQPPEPANEGPWTVRIPGRAYMRFIIKGGNMQANNLMQVRILPSAVTAQVQPAARLVKAAYLADPAPAPAAILPTTSVEGLLGVTTPETAKSISGVQSLTSSGVIGYAVGGSGSQALVAIANPDSTDVRLLLADKDVTDGTQTVAIGQSITLSAELSGGAKPSSATPWNVPGHKVGGYSQTLQVSAILPFQQTAQTTHFYWVEPGTSFEVTYAYIRGDGSTAIAKTTFDVAAPHGGVTGTMSDVQLTFNPGGPRYNGQLRGEWMMLGSVPLVLPVLGSVPPVDFGIAITPTATSDEVGPGTYAWIQAVISDTSPPAGKPKGRCYYDFSTKDATLHDSPGGALNPPPPHSQVSKGYEVKRTFQARTYLTWQINDPDSIPVSVGSIAWGYYGDAVYNGTSSDEGWLLNPSSNKWKTDFVQRYSLLEWSPLRCPQ